MEKRSYLKPEIAHQYNLYPKTIIAVSNTLNETAFDNLEDCLVYPDYSSNNNETVTTAWNKNNFGETKCFYMDDHDSSESACTTLFKQFNITYTKCNIVKVTKGTTLSGQVTYTIEAANNCTNVYDQCYTGNGGH